jgi:membrane protein implicated in regulation of membrane protease activity
MRGMVAIAVLVLGACQIGDGITTWIGLRAGAIEGNPVASWFFASIGVLATILLFKSLGLFIASKLWKIRRRIAKSRPLAGLIACVSAFYLFVVVNNSLVL